MGLKDTQPWHRRPFVLLQLAQLLALAGAVLLQQLAAPSPLRWRAVLLGGGISVAANLWAGYQLWLHPARHLPGRAAGAAMRAEAGKVAIVLVLFGVTYSHWPAASQGATGMALVLGFLWVYLVGLFALRGLPGTDMNTSAK